MQNEPRPQAQREAAASVPGGLRVAGAQTPPSAPGGGGADITRATLPEVLMHPGDPHTPPSVPGDCPQTGRDKGQSALASPVWGVHLARHHEGLGGG